MCKYTIFFYLGYFFYRFFSRFLRLMAKDQWSEFKVQKKGATLSNRAFLYGL